MVDREHEGVRLDIFIVDRLKGISRSGIRNLIETGNVLFNGKRVKPHHKVHAGGEVEVFIPSPKETTIAAEKIPLDVLYEDKDLLVINKPAGMIVHPAGRITTGTLVNALLAHCENLSGIGGVLKPGIVHRLDKGTTGCIVVAQNDETHQNLSEQFASRKVRKEYLGIVHGKLLNDSGVLLGLIARHPVHRKRMAVRQDTGREAETRFEVLERYDDFSYVKLILLTGRTHQIRVQMAHLGHPVIGDDLYGRRRPIRLDEIRFERPMIHSWRLAFRHPRTGQVVSMEAPIPDDIELVLNRLRGKGSSG